MSNNFQKLLILGFLWWVLLFACFLLLHFFLLPLWGVYGVFFVCLVELVWFWGFLFVLVLVLVLVLFLDSVFPRSIRLFNIKQNLKIFFLVSV